MSYVEQFRARHVDLTDEQVEKVREELEAELGELVERGEFSSCQYDSAEWELDVINMIINERRHHDSIR
jgi:hypothetical protein